MSKSAYTAYNSGYVTVPSFWAWASDKMDRYSSETEARIAYKRAVKSGTTRARNRHDRDVEVAHDTAQLNAAINEPTPTKADLIAKYGSLQNLVNAAVGVGHVIK